MMNRNFKIVCAVLFLFYFEACSSSSSIQRYGNSKNNLDLEINSSSKTTADSLFPTEKITTEFDFSEETMGYEDEILDDCPINYSTVIDNFNKTRNTGSYSSLYEKIMQEVICYLDTPYRYGGTTRAGMDCSGFTSVVMQNAAEVSLPRSSSEQFYIGEKITTNGDLKFGDLVFFNTARRTYPGHVGIYLGDNLFAHASRKIGVTISNLDETYYKKRFVGARRLEELK